MSFRDELSEGKIKKYKYTLTNVTDEDAVNGLEFKNLIVKKAGGDTYLLSFKSDLVWSAIEDYINKELGLSYDNIERNQ